LFEYNDKSVKLINLSIPYILEILLNDKSSHFKFVNIFKF